LEALKMVDFVLQHERPSSLEVLTPQGLQLLAKARATPLEPPDDHAICQHKEICFQVLSMRKSPIRAGFSLLFQEVTSS
jgi:hypothetical protein